MTTPPTPGERPSDEDSRWAEPSPISLDKPAEPDPAAVPFDPYRFGAPEHPVPPEYAPPGYVPPQPPPQPQPPVVDPANPYAYQQPYGQPPYQQPYGQPPYQQPYGQYPPQPYPPYGAPPFHQYPQPRNTNGKAIAALVLGVLAIPGCVLSFLDLALIIPAIVFGSLALNEARRPGGTGRGLAVSGLICAVLAAVLAVTITVWIYPKVARCINDYPSGSTEYNNCIRDIFN